MVNSAAAVVMQFGAIPMLLETSFNSLHGTHVVFRKSRRDGLRFGNLALLAEAGAPLFGAMLREQIADNWRGEISFPVRWRGLSRAEMFMPTAPTPDPRTDEELMDVVAAYPCDHEKHPKPVLSAEETEKRRVEAHAAYRELHRRHFSRLSGILKARGAGDQAVPLAQRAFAKIWDKRCLWHVRHVKKHFRGWSAIIAIHLFWDTFHPGTAPKFISLDSLSARAVASGEKSGYDAAVRSEVKQFVTDCLRRLPPKDEQLLLLHYFGDLTREKVAEMLGMTVGQLLHREKIALGKLRICLLVKGISPGPDIVPKDDSGASAKSKKRTQ